MAEWSQPQPKHSSDDNLTHLTHLTYLTYLTHSLIHSLTSSAINSFNSLTGNGRWLIAALLFMAAVLNYVDKNSLALLAPTIQKDLGFGDQTYANIQNAFQIAYTLALLGSGVLVDRLGPRISLALFVAWWSLANVLTTCARSVVSLGTFRFLLGLGEAGNWTASPKTVAQWFTLKEQGLAMGIYTAGTPVGMTLAPLFIIWLAEAFGWRSAFAVTGLAGGFWLLLWFGLHRWPITERGHSCPQQRPITCGVLHRPAAATAETVPVSKKCRTPDIVGDNVRSPLPAEQTQEGLLTSSPTAPVADGHWTWLGSFCHLEVLCLLIARMLSDPIWFFYQNWYPKYLVAARGFTQAQVSLTWIMFLAAGLGSLFGGWVTGSFIKRGHDPRRVRMFAMAGCALLMPLSPLVASAPGAASSLTIASIIVFGHLAWLVNLSALVIDVTPNASLGSVFGIVAAGSSLGAIAMNSIVAKAIAAGSYAPWFGIAAFPHLCVLPLLYWGVLAHSAKAPHRP
ncbi:MAG: MFS transporter [Verrucomicrobia bacterium]|nr:MAG: MFS transporter [Verrucomicrobiota bacterium]